MPGKFLIRLMLSMAAVMFTASLYAAEDPTMHQVYLAAEAGKFGEAQAMMDQVLRDHPNSGKAHFVEAELLAKQGRFANAEAELSTAERLAPGLPFAKPTAVQNLRANIAASHGAARSSFAQHTVQAPGNSGPPLNLLIVGIGLIVFIVLAVRFMNRRTAVTYVPNATAGYGPGPAMQPYGMGSPGSMAGPVAGGGIGSGILGGLATGAAIGGGIVAGEALMHHFTDGNRNDGNYVSPPVRDDFSAPNDLGGTDFGIADNSSWDDGSSGGGGSDDWS